MLTRLRVKGFKNLVDVDVRFGQFTCIAGPNGAGKSNLFDAITFLGDLASMPIMKAASRARGTNGRISDFHSLFFKDSQGEFAPMLFIAEMIVPSTVTDDFDRPAKPTATFLEYTLELRLSEPNADATQSDPIYIEQEGLRAINSSEAAKHLGFFVPPEWSRKHIFGPGSKRTPFISTTVSGNPSQPSIRLFGDQTKKGGPPFLVPARKSPQTIVSGANSSSHPTALAARSELRSWRLLQLEPSALRRFDNFGDDPHITPIGEHLPGALMRLDNHAGVSQRLSELLPDIVSVNVDADEKRQVKMLLLTMKDKQTYTASSLSDGTLRFMALAVLALDPEFAMHGSEAPGTVIGTMDAKDINYASNYLANLVRTYNLPPKILIVHRFTEDMVTHDRLITPLPEVQIVMDMDGWGSQAKKIGTYNAVIYLEPVEFTGFKIFYKNDIKPPSTGLLSPAEVLKLTPSPSFIQYQ